VKAEECLIEDREIIGGFAGAESIGKAAQRKTVTGLRREHAQGEIADLMNDAQNGAEASAERRPGEGNSSK